MRQSAGNTPSDALEAQERKRLQLEAADSGLALKDLNTTEDRFPLTKAIDAFLRDIKTIRKPLTHEKYAHILELFSEHVAPKSEVMQITGDDIKGFLAWRKSKGFDPGTTLYTDRVVPHNFFGKLGIWQGEVLEAPAHERAGIS